MQAYRSAANNKRPLVKKETIRQWIPITAPTPTKIHREIPQVEDATM